MRVEHAAVGLEAADTRRRSRTRAGPHAPGPRARPRSGWPVASEPNQYISSRISCLGGLDRGEHGRQASRAVVKELHAIAPDHVRCAWSQREHAVRRSQTRADCAWLAVHTACGYLRSSSLDLDRPHPRDHLQHPQGQGRRRALHDRNDGARAARSAEHNVDLVLCQEVFHCARTGARRAATWRRRSASPRYYGANKFRDIGHHGNTTFTRFHGRALRQSRYLDQPHRAHAARCTCALARHGRPLHVFNVHLGLNRWQRIESDHARSAQLLAERCKPGEPVVLAGDFNDWSRSSTG